MVALGCCPLSPSQSAGTSSSGPFKNPRVPESREGQQLQPWCSPGWGELSAGQEAGSSLLLHSTNSSKELQGHQTAPRVTPRSPRSPFPGQHPSFLSTPSNPLHPRVPQGTVGRALPAPPSLEHPQGAAGSLKPQLQLGCSLLLPREEAPGVAQTSQVPPHIVLSTSRGSRPG